MPESTAPHISLKRDATGRITEKTLSLGETPETRRYRYDSAGRLAQVTDERGALLESYSYDHQARRLADIRPESQVGERRFSYGHGDRLAAAGNTQYSHDRAGFRNLKVAGAPGLGGAETWFHYESSGLLLAVDLPSASAGGSRIEYAYDSSGLRLEKRLNGRLVAAYDWLDPLRLSEFFDGHEWWRFAYLDESKGGRTPVGVTNGRDSFLLLADQLGTPLALATLDGRVVQFMRYDSFGNLLERRGAVVDLPLGFAGGLFDQDTGLTRFVWRDYDAETGRFTALDPLREKGGDADFYGYCVDDPVNRVDALGLWSLFGAEFGGDGRSWWQPRYGNWGGQDWSGGQNPKQRGGEDGPQPPVDSSDELYKRHDQDWGRCENEDILSSDPAKWRRDCKRDADNVLMDGLERLPQNPKDWDRPPAPGQENVASAFSYFARKWFK